VTVRYRSNTSKGGGGDWFVSALAISNVQSRLQIVGITVAMALILLARPGAADTIPELLQQTHWGETTQDLLHQFAGAARPLTRSVDFGDSYANVVLNNDIVGGVSLVVFFQMDKATHGLRRIQLELPHHSVNPPAFRAISAALYAAYGNPDQRCVVPVRPVGGYQAAVEELWVRGADVISAIYRDATLQAFEGCLYGITSGPCGLTGRILVRISPADGSAGPDPCSLALDSG
jgi:hypothetical protein